jgi:hypothetical protein
LTLTAAASSLQANNVTIPVRMVRRKRGIGQRRFWEHLIRDDEDFRQVMGCNKAGSSILLNRHVRHLRKASIIAIEKNAVTAAISWLLQRSLANPYLEPLNAWYSRRVPTLKSL